MTLVGRAISWCFAAATAIVRGPSDSVAVSIGLGPVEGSLAQVIASGRAGAIAIPANLLSAHYSAGILDTFFQDIAS